jgi:hypothetical protein
MTNKDMVPRPGPGPAPRDRSAPKGGKRQDVARKDPGATSDFVDPPDSPKVIPSQDRK